MKDISSGRRIRLDASSRDSIPARTLVGDPTKHFDSLLEYCVLLCRTSDELSLTMVWQISFRCFLCGHNRCGILVNSGITTVCVG